LGELPNLDLGNGALSGIIATEAGVTRIANVTTALDTCSMYYNADLLYVAGRDDLGLGFIDDIAYEGQGQGLKIMQEDLRKRLKMPENGDGSTVQGLKQQNMSLYTTQEGVRGRTQSSGRQVNRTEVHFWLHDRRLMKLWRISAKVLYKM